MILMRSKSSIKVIKLGMYIDHQSRIVKEWTKLVQFTQQSIATGEKEKRHFVTMELFTMPSTIGINEWIWHFEKEPGSNRFCGLCEERNFRLNVLEMFDKWLKHATLRLAIISQWSIRSQVGDSGKSRPLIFGRFLRVRPYAWNSPLRHILDIEKFESAGLSSQVRNEWEMNVWESIFRRLSSSNSDNYRLIK